MQSYTIVVAPTWDCQGRQGLGSTIVLTRRRLALANWAYMAAQQGGRCHEVHLGFLETNRQRLVRPPPAPRLPAPAPTPPSHCARPAATCDLRRRTNNFAIIAPVTTQQYVAPRELCVSACKIEFNVLVCAASLRQTLLCIIIAENVSVRQIHTAVWRISDTITMKKNSIRSRCCCTHLRSRERMSRGAATVSSAACAVDSADTGADPRTAAASG